MSMKVAPSSGLSEVRLRWSLISTGCPADHAGLMPPAPLVSTITVAPVAAAVRTLCTTLRTPWPS